jgi:hypothetical protein
MMIEPTDTADEIVDGTRRFCMRTSSSNRSGITKGSSNLNLAGF